MRSCTTSAEESFTGQNTLVTPMRRLIKRFPDLAELVLDKSYKEVKRDSEVCIEMNFEFVEDTFNYQKKEEKKIPINLNPFKQQDFTFQHFTFSDQKDERNEGYEEPYTNDYEMIMRNHPMVIMADNSRTELLRHPLCLALVRKKWKTYGEMFFYGLHLFPYLLFLGFLTMFVLTSPNPVTHSQYYNCSQFFYNQSSRPILTDTMHPDLNHTDWNIFSKWGIWILTAFFLVMDVLLNKPIVLIKAVMYFNLPWTIIINYVIYGMALFITAQAEMGYDVLDSEIHSKKLRSVCLVGFF